MAYNALNNLIDAYIYANGVQAITGQILNGVLKQMVSQLGSGYHLMGVAGPQTSPASEDYAMAYFAATAGEYTDFGGITLAAGEVAVLLTFGNGSWSKQTVYNVPTGTADLENTADFITNAVTDLVNYYTKTEIDTTLADYPTLSNLATALADYYTKTEIDGQKAVTDAALADRYTKSETNTKLEDYYKKTETYDKDEVDSIVAALSRQEYIVAWDGLAAPDVSAIPAGVTVTYSGMTYTGTLDASASTVNKIYMVWNGVAYDMYGTSQDGGYSWVPMGTTTVDLSQYAKEENVEQLAQTVDDIETTIGTLASESDVTNTYTVQENMQAYGNVGGTITFVTLHNYGYYRIDLSTIQYGSRIRVTFYTGVADASSYVQYTNSSNIITRRLYVNAPRDTYYTFELEFENEETSVYVTGKLGEFSIIKIEDGELPDTIVNLVKNVGQLQDVTIADNPATIVDALNKLGSLSFEIKSQFFTIPQVMSRYENTALRNRFIYGTVGGAIQYTYQGAGDVRTATIPLDGVESVEYPVFKSTSGYGSLLVDANSIVVEPLVNTTLNNGTIVTKDTTQYVTGGYMIMVSVYPYASSQSLFVRLHMADGSTVEKNLNEYVNGLVKDDLSNPTWDTVISTLGLSKLLNNSGTQFPFKDFGVMPSCLASDPDSFLQDGVDAGGDALVTYADVISKYDELVTAYPDYVTKTELGYDASGTIMMYSYTFEPKYWKQSIYLQAGVHGWEPDPVFALAEIMFLISNAYGESVSGPYDAGNDILLYLRGNVKFTIVPVVNPWGFNDRGDCVFSNARRGQNNYNNVQLNADWWSQNPQAETSYVEAILTNLKDELSFTIDMHSTVHNDTRERYGCFYGGYNINAKNVLTIMRTYEWLYRFYDVKYPQIVDGDSAPNPLGDGYASIGTMTNVFSAWCYDILGIQSSTMEFSDHTWTPELHTSVALSVAVNMYLNQIIQQVSAGYVIAGDNELPTIDIYPAKG